MHDFTEPATVEGFAHAAIGVPRSAILLRDQRAERGQWRPTFYWSGGLVVAKHSLLTASVDRKHLRRVCGAVGGAANQVGTLMAPLFGGTTPFPPVELAPA